MPPSSRGISLQKIHKEMPDMNDVEYPSKDIANTCKSTALPN